MLRNLMRLPFSILSGCAWAGFMFVRLAERSLPQRVLNGLLWLVAPAWGVVQINKTWSAVASWERLSTVERSPGRARIWFWQAIASHHARFVYLFPERLPERRWIRRCRLTGPTDPLQMHGEGRRIVFASLHFGPFETLPYWLRAQGLPVTTLVGRAAPRQRLKQRQYSLTPPAGLPVVLPVTEMGGIRLAVSQLQHLLVLMDVDRGRQIELPVDRLIFRLATGAIRIAAMTEAELVPCLTAVAPGWRFSIHFGTPVPARLLGPAPDIAGAASHLLNELLPFMRKHPAQCGSRLLSCIRVSENFS